MIKKKDLVRFCQSIEEQRAYLATLGLTDADISDEASRMIGVYEKRDVIKPSQEDFDALVAELEASRPLH